MFHPDSWVQMASMQPKSDGDIPNCGISALARVRGSAEERSSVRVRAGPEALDRLRERARLASGARSSERDTLAAPRPARSAWLSGRAEGLGTLPAADRAAPGSEAGRVATRTPPPTTRPVTASETADIRAARRAPRRLPVRRTGALRCLAVWCSDKAGDPTVDDTDVSRARATLLCECHVGRWGISARTRGKEGPPEHRKLGACKLKHAWVCHLSQERRGSHDHVLQ